MISKGFYEIKYTKEIAQVYGMESKRVWMIWNLYREIERTGCVCNNSLEYYKIIKHGFGLIANNRMLLPVESGIIQNYYWC